MTLPIPLIEPATAGRTLARALVDLETANPDPAGAPPRLLVTLPVAWANRYQVLLYSAAARRRHAVVGLRSPADLARISWPGPVILHAHWFASIFHDAPTEDAAMARLETAMEQIVRFRNRTGARLLWTAHNLFPHGNRLPRTFLTLRQWVFDMFDAVHVMQPEHLPQLETAFGRRAPPAFAVPHMTYDGTLADCVDPLAARVQFRLPAGAFVLGYFGSLQDYKRLPELLQAVDRLAAAGRNVMALVGGIPGEDGAAQRLALGWGLSPRVRLLARQIPDHEVQYLHRAADLMVLPYAETLNSGAALMAASFRRPFLMPRGGASAGLAGLGLVTYDDDGPQALERALAAAMEGPLPVADPAALARRHPAAVSAAFFDALARLWPD